MTDQDIRDFLERMAAEEPMTFLDAEPLTRRGRRRAARTVVVGAVGVAAAIAVLFAGASQLREVSPDFPAIDPTPTPSGSILRSAGEILWYPEDDVGLLAVNPVTGEERVLVEEVPHLSEAKWSADGRWVAYEMWSGTRSSLWVVGEDLEPREIMDLPDEDHRSWAWSSTGAQLAVNRNSMLHLIDPATGLVTELASTTWVGSPPTWSPDDTRIVLGATGGTIYAVDVRTGDRSVLAELPGEDLGDIDAMEWSPDGSRLAIFSDVEPGSGRLFVLNPDGSDIHVVAEEDLVIQLDWSPDGSRIVFAADAVEGPWIDIWIAHADGTPAYLVASPDYSGYLGWGSPAWSPDGSRIGFSVAPNRASAIAADGSGDAVPIDDLTYASWSGGSFCRTCALWRSDAGRYTGPSDT